MTALIDRLLGPWYVRKCGGCETPEFHTAHLTRLGRWRWT